MRFLPSLLSSSSATLHPSTSTSLPPPSPSLHPALQSPASHFVIRRTSCPLSPACTLVVALAVAHHVPNRAQELPREPAASAAHLSSSAFPLLFLPLSLLLPHRALAPSDVMCINCISSPCALFESAACREEPVPLPALPPPSPPPNRPCPRPSPSPPLSLAHPHNIFLDAPASLLQRFERSPTRALPPAQPHVSARLRCPPPPPPQCPL
jgi:hypothetical protein